MPLWIYSLPTWLLAALIVGAWVGVGVGGHAAWHRWLRAPLGDSERQGAIGLLVVVATINSLLLAFSAASVWDASHGAERAVRQEGETLAELGRQLAVLGSPEARLARERLRAYGRTVVGKEWPAMREQQASLPTADAFDALFRALGDIQPGAPLERTLMPAIWQRTNELLRYRNARLEANHGQMPRALWVVVGVGSLLTLSFAGVLPRTRFNRVAIGLVSLSVGLVFFFVAAMDRPFHGDDSRGAAPIEASLRAMERWDLKIGAGGRSP